MIHDDEAKIIYSKRFPQIDLDEFCKEQDLTKENISEPPVPFEQFYKHLIEDSTYIANLSKLKFQSKFIDIAISLSTEYEIDMDIRDYRYYISVRIFLRSGFCAGRLKALVALLFSMCDRVYYFKERSGDYDFSINLDYHTYDHYISGRKVDF